MEAKMTRARLVAALALLTLGMTACGGATSPGTSTDSASIGVAGGHLGTPTVVIAATDQNTFNPVTERVRVGEIVEWKNDGSVAHNIIFADDASIGDPVIEAGGGVWQVKFTVAGTYQYSCTIHTGMVGTIVVSSG
jgi:plastocyanin